MSTWTEVKPDKGGTSQFTPFWQIRGRDCYITLEARPHYCDRGNFVAKIFGHGNNASWVRLGLDGQDGWPRYYFDQDRAKAEVEAWLRKREQWVD